MDIFQNHIDPIKFKATNLIWNGLGLNSPWSVGYVSTLIESRDFNSKEDWKAYYYQSGVERLEQIEKCCTPEQKRQLLNFEKPALKLPKELKNLNLSYGRTERELEEKGRYMHEKLAEVGNPKKLTLAEVIYAVKYRVMGETWNGIMARERNTVSTLEVLFPDLLFEKTEGEIDYKYGIDYEVYEERDLLCAIQIKPISYKNGHSPEIVKAKKANEHKNADYKKNYDSDVLYVYSNSKGSILNEDVVGDIRKRVLLKHEIFHP